MLQKLTGYKTYILGTLGILYAVGGFFTGHLDSQSALGVLFASLTAMGIRNGITTEVQALAAKLPDKTLPPQQ
jgi:hypothetical protein